MRESTVTVSRKEESPRFHSALARNHNTRGGYYVPGFYSVTCHVAFGKRTAATPGGRKTGESLAASLGSTKKEIIARTRLVV